MSKNGAYIGERYVRLLHVPKQEMQEQVRLGTIAVPGNAHRRGRVQQQLQQQQHQLQHAAAAVAAQQQQAAAAAAQFQQQQQAPYQLPRGAFDAAGGGTSPAHHHLLQPQQQQQQQQHAHHAAYGVMDHLQLPPGAVLAPAPPRMLDGVPMQQYAVGPGPGGGPGGAAIQMVAAGPGGAPQYVAVSPVAGGLAPQLLQVAPGGVAAVQMGGGGGAMGPQVLGQERLQVAMPGAQLG
jgi:heterogeneous nuclear ribonucleoprotein F/H